MQRLLGLVAVLFAVLAILVAVGCKEDEEERPAPVVGSVDVALGQDTLCISILGIEDTTSVIVTVLSTRNEPMPGVHVNVALAHDNWDSLEYTDPVRRDTTDHNGQVVLIYRAYATGMNWISATVDGISDSAYIVAEIPSTWPPSFLLVVDPDTIHLTPPDSTQVWIHFVGELGPVVGFTATMSVSGGIIDPMPPTDSVGYAQTYWHPTDTGRFWMTTQYPWTDLCHHLMLNADTAWVTVLPLPPVGQVQILATDTLYLVPGDTVTTSVMLDSFRGVRT